MEMTACQSSNVQEFGYDAEARVLAVRFRNGLYHYKDVPPEIFEGIGRAESVGKFVNGNVVGHFAAEKVKEVAAADSETERHEHEWAVDYEQPTADVSPVHRDVYCECGATACREDGTGEIHELKEPPTTP